MNRISRRVNGCWRPYGRLAVGVVAMLALASAPAARAATLTWSASGTATAIGGTGTWDTSALQWTANGSTWSAWSNAGIDTAVFAGTAGTVTLNTGITVGGLTFSTTDYNLAGNTLTIAGGTAPITVNANAATIGSIVTGTAMLQKLGSGTLTLNGANTYTGQTSVAAGTLVIGSGGSIASAGSINTIGGGLLSISGSVGMGSNTYFAVASGVASATGTTAINGGFLAVGTSAFLIGGGRGDATTSAGRGVFAVNSGTVTVAASSGNQGGSDANRVWLNPYGTSGTSSLLLNGGVFSTAREIRNGSGSQSVVAFNGGTLRAAASIDLLPSGANSSGQNVNNIWIHSGGATIDSGTFSATISNVISTGTGSPAGGLTKTGSGSLTLSGANTFSGGVALSVGQLNVNNASALGTGTFTISTGGTIGNTSGAAITLSTNNAQVWNGDFAFAGTSGLNLGTGTVALGGNSVVTVTSNTLTVGGTIGGAFGLTKQGAGTLTLTGSNLFSGGATVSAGQLNVNNPRALGTGTFTISGGTIDNTSGGAVALATNNPQAWNGNFTFAGSNPLDLGTGAVTLSASRQVTVTSSTLTVGGSIGGAVGLTKAGAGTLAIGPAGSFASAGNVLISGGLLSISGSVGMGSNTYLAVASGVASATGTTAINGGFLAVGTSAFLIGGGRGDALASVGRGVFVVNSGTVTVAASSGNQGGSDANNIWLNPYGNGGASSLLLNGGVFSTARSIRDGTGGGSILGFNGGTLQAAASIDLLPSGGQGVRTVSIHSGGAVIDTGTFSVSISNILATGTGSPAGGLRKIGSGTLTLSAANTYSGSTTISAGVLDLNAATSAGSAAITIGDASTGASNTGLFMSANSSYTLANAVVVSSFGSGTVTIGGRSTSNTAANTYSGAVSLGRDVRLEAGSTDSRTTFSGSMTGAGGITITQGRVTFDTIAKTYGGSTTVNPGAILQLTGGELLPDATALTVNGLLYFASLSATTTETVGSLAGSGTIQSHPSVPGTYTLAVDQASNTTFSGAIINGTTSATVALRKAGSGTLTLTGANTYSGPTTISAGGLALAGLGSLPTTGAVAITGSGATLDISGATGDRTIGMLTGTAGSVVALGGRTLTVGDATSGTFAGGIGGTGGLTKQGAGRLTLSASNTFTGPATITAGTLALSVGGRIDASAVNLAAADAVLDIAGASGGRTIGGLSGAAGSQVLLGNNTLTVGNGFFAGVISGSGGLTTRTGGGILVLSDVQAFTGPARIEEGTLVLGGTNTLASASSIFLAADAILQAAPAGLTIVNNQTLAGSGDVTEGALLFLAGSILSPGGSVGQLDGIAGATLSGGMTYLFEINDASGVAGGAGGAGWDLFTSTGVITLDVTGSPIILDVNTLNGTVSGSAANFNPFVTYAWKFLVAGEGNEIAFSPTWFSVDTSGFGNATDGGFYVARGDELGSVGLSGSSNELYLVYAAVPEPGTLVLAGVGLAACLAWHRRRRRR